MAGVAVVMLVAVLGAALRGAEAECIIDKSVKEASERVYQQDLLQTLAPIMGKSSGAVKDSRGNAFEFSVCSDVRKDVANVSLAQTSKNPVVPLGFNNQTLVTSDKHWLMLTFLGGPPLPRCNGTSGHVLFICDPDEYNMNMQVLDDSNLTLNSSAMFVVRHHCVCSLTPKGLSGTAIFFIIVLVTFALYFTFGFFYLRLVKGAKGIEQIPNRTFWFRVGNLLADGCEAVFRCDRYCVAGERPPSSYSGYSAIDEQFAQDLQDGDRDAALISP